MKEGGITHTTPKGETGSRMGRETSNTKRRENEIFEETIRYKKKEVIPTDSLNSPHRGEKNPKKELHKDLPPTKKQKGGGEIKRYIRGECRLRGIQSSEGPTRGA